MNNYSVDPKVVSQVSYCPHGKREWEASSVWSHSYFKVVKSPVPSTQTCHLPQGKREDESNSVIASGKYYWTKFSTVGQGLLSQIWCDKGSHCSVFFWSDDRISDLAGRMVVTCKISNGWTLVGWTPTSVWKCEKCLTFLSVVAQFVHRSLLTVVKFREAMGIAVVALTVWCMIVYNWMKRN